MISLQLTILEMLSPQSASGGPTSITIGKSSAASLVRLLAIAIAVFEVALALRTEYQTYSFTEDLPETYQAFKAECARDRTKLCTIVQHECKGAALSGTTRKTMEEICNDLVYPHIRDRRKFLPMQAVVFLTLILLPAVSGYHGANTGDVWLVFIFTAFCGLGIFSALVNIATHYARSESTVFKVMASLDDDYDYLTLAIIVLVAAMQTMGLYFSTKLIYDAWSDTHEVHARDPYYVVECPEYGRQT